MEDFNDFKIDNYLRRELSAQDMIQMEREIQNNPKLASEIKRRQAIINHIKALEYRKMLAQINEIHQKEHSKLHLRPIKSYRILVAAATLLLLLTVGWYLWETSSNSQNLYAQYYQSYDLRFGNRSDNDLLSEAGGYYIDGNFEKAAPLFQEVLAKTPEETKAIFALGIAQMELKHWDTAIFSFQQLIQNKDVLYADNAKWYMALSLYQLNRIVETKALLEELSQNKKADFSAQANDFLKKIK